MFVLYIIARQANNVFCHCTVLLFLVYDMQYIHTSSLGEYSFAPRKKHLMCESNSHSVSLIPIAEMLAMHVVTSKANTESLTVLLWPAHGQYTHMN